MHLCMCMYQCGYVHEYAHSCVKLRGVARKFEVVRHLCMYTFIKLMLCFRLSGYELHLIIIKNQ